MHGLLRGLAILGLAPERDGTIDAPRGADALLQVGALVLALALGKPQGPLLRFGLLWGQRIPLYHYRSRSKVARAFIEAKDASGPSGTGRQHLPGARGIPALQAPSHGIVLQGPGRHCFAQQQGRILVRKELFQALPRTPPTQGSEEHAPHDGPRIAGHLRRDQLMARLDQTNLVSLGLHHGQRLNRIRFARREHAPHITLLRRRRLVYLLSCDNNLTLLGCAVRGKNAPGKIGGSPSEGGGMCGVNPVPVCFGRDKG